MMKLFTLLGTGLFALLLSFSYNSKKIVILDIGHGGKDHGVTFEEFNEKDIALSIAKKIVSLNNNSNLKIILTRNADKEISLDDRIGFVHEKKADLAISIHVNAANKNTLGTEIYTCTSHKEKEASQRLANKLKSSFSDRPVEIKDANFRFLRNANCPSVLLEVGFLTNPSDRELLTNQKGQEKFAKAIYKAIQ